MSTDQSTRPEASPSRTAEVGKPFDLAGFAHALVSGDLGYQLARYAGDAEVRITTDTGTSAPRVVSGTPAISAWLHEAASTEPPSAVSRLVDGGDRVAFTRHWRHPDGTTVVSISTAELQHGLITTQHTILVLSREAVPAVVDG